MLKSIIGKILSIIGQGLKQVNRYCATSKTKQHAANYIVSSIIMQQMIIILYFVINELFCTFLIMLLYIANEVFSNKLL